MSSNLTHLDEDPLADLDYEGFERNLVDEALDVWDVISVSLRFILTIASTAACVFLIYVIVKFKELKTCLNFYFLHFAIAYIFTALYLLTVYLVLLGVRFPSYYLVTCWIYNLQMTVSFLKYLFVTAAIVHWYFLEYKNHYLKQHEKLQKYFIMILYLIGVVTFIFALPFCKYQRLRKYADYVLISLYFLLLAIILAVNYLKCKNPVSKAGHKTRYVLIGGTYIILTLAPVLLLHFCLTLIVNLTPSRILRIIVIFVGTIPSYFIDTQPIVILILFGRCDRNFKMVYDKIFKKEEHELIRETDGDDDDENAPQV